jgi:hypothetical protein
VGLMSSESTAWSGNSFVTTAPSNSCGTTPLPLAFWPLLGLIVCSYLALVELTKRRFEPRV